MYDGEHFLLGSLQHPEVRLRRELSLKVRRSDTSVSITWDEASIFAEANSFETAVNRFRLKVADEFKRLSAAGNVPAYFAEKVCAGRVYVASN